MRGRRFNLVSALATLTVLGWLVLAGCARGDDYAYSGIISAPPTHAPDVTLTGSDGQAFHLHDLADKWVLVLFGYTNCPDVCPLTLSHLSKVLRDLGPQADRVAVVFISVDPDRDTADRLSKYAASFGPQVHGVTGTRSEIDQAVADYGAHYEINQDAGESAAGYTVSHSADVYVVDPQGRLRFTIPFGVDPERMLADLRHLMERSD